MSETVSSSTEIAAPAEPIFAVLTDFAGYGDWAGSVQSVDVQATDDAGRGTRVAFVVSAGPLGKKRYVLDYTYGERELSWTYVEGDFADLHGSYVLTEGAGTTEVTYHLAIDPGFPLPGFLKARAAREIARQALKGLKRKIEG